MANSIGLERRGFTQTQIDRIQDVYRILFVFNHNVSKALQQILEEVSDSEERAIILGFIAKSERGLIKGLQTSKD